ncbi:MAG: PDZ domain-containing protein [Oscillospiraceae bacterium]|jgi:carboxyl-terminal processing protease|nr:PDZ domain-containing protein [Oscillospiraceae bacterium]
MNKKISAGVCVSLIAIACAVTFVITWTVSLNMYNDRFAGVAVRDDISAKLQEIDSFVRNNYYGVVDDEKIASGIFNGYISGVDDKNTVYMTADEYAKSVRGESGKIVTCGIIPAKEVGGYIKVEGVYSGSSAEGAGVQKGDVIISIDGTNVLEAGADAAVKLLEGEDGTRFSLTAQRRGEVHTFQVRRQSLDIISVEGAAGNGVGFIRITDFNELTAAQFAAVIQSVLKAEPKALVVDLRQNSSDYYEPLKKMLNGLVGAGTIAYTEYKNGIRRDFVVADSSERVSVPMIVLVDGSTAGAGELMAAALKSHLGAQLVGSATAGKATMQSTQQLKDGSAVRVTVARIRLTSGFDYEGAGLTPDYAVDMSADVAYDINGLGDISAITDPQIKKALEIIETSN